MNLKYQHCGRSHQMNSILCETFRPMHVWAFVFSYATLSPSLRCIYFWWPLTSEKLTNHSTHRAFGAQCWSPFIVLAVLVTLLVGEGGGWGGGRAIINWYTKHPWSPWRSTNDILSQHFKGVSWHSYQRACLHSCQRHEGRQTGKDAGKPLEKAK